MKDKGAAGLVFPAPAEDDEEEAPASEPGETSGSDELLGNAFDAFTDGDRAGFIASMRAALRAR